MHNKIWIFDEDLVKSFGFDNVSELNKLVATLDISSPKKLALFKKWQEEDGTKDGLLKLHRANNENPGGD